MPLFADDAVLPRFADDATVLVPGGEGDNGHSRIEVSSKLIVTETISEISLEDEATKKKFRVFCLYPEIEICMKVGRYEGTFVPSYNTYETKICVKNFFFWAWYASGYVKGVADEPLRGCLNSKP